ncbi:hypothetical protein BGZ60DRAFT_435319 [Tricladium varicosporioides]|nr:hypothetical protein BGZ60DRAFT_435319 [Hymenoscyphus varicosporioides]
MSNGGLFRNPQEKANIFAVKVVTLGGLSILCVELFLCYINLGECKNLIIPLCSSVSAGMISTFKYSPWAVIYCIITLLTNLCQRIAKYTRLEAPAATRDEQVQVRKEKAMEHLHTTIRNQEKHFYEDNRARNRLIGVAQKFELKKKHLSDKVTALDSSRDEDVSATPPKNIQGGLSSEVSSRYSRDINPKSSAFGKKDTYYGKDNRMLLAEEHDMREIATFPQTLVQDQAQENDKNSEMEDISRVPQGFPALPVYETPGNPVYASENIQHQDRIGTSSVLLTSYPSLGTPFFCSIVDERGDYSLSSRDYEVDDTSYLDNQQEAGEQILQEQYGQKIERMHQMVHGALINRVGQELQQKVEDITNIEISGGVTMAGEGLERSMDEFMRQVGYQGEKRKGGIEHNGERYYGRQERLEGEIEEGGERQNEDGEGKEKEEQNRQDSVGEDGGDEKNNRKFGYDSNFNFRPDFGEENCTVAAEIAWGKLWHDAGLLMSYGPHNKASGSGDTERVACNWKSVMD